ncbi:phage tail protein [bacterium]|nr:phage tail protein [bacterium]
MFAEWTLTKILSRVEISPVRKNYNFNKQERINTKPVLQAGNENLEEYACKLQLHVQFCNPRKIISLLEERAKSREPIEWIYNKEYKGLFVIDSIEKTVIKQIKNTILYAEINFNMVEFPQDEEFQQQKQGEADLSEVEQYSSTSNKLKDFAKKTKDSIVENLKETVVTSTISGNLSDAAKEIYSTVTEGVIKDIAGANITEMYNTAKYYADIVEQNSTLSFSDVQTLISAISSIPDLMINSALRGSIND